MSAYRNLALRILITLFAAGAGACGGGGHFGGGFLGDGGGTDDGGSGAKAGFVALSDQTTTTFAYAYFAPPATDTHCTSVTSGACSIEMCTHTGADGGAAPGTFPNPGMIQLAGGLSPVSLSPAADGSYATETLPMRVWNGGEMLKAAALGATVPLFSVTLNAPFPAVVKMPDMLPIMANRTIDLPLQWSGGIGTVLRAYLTSAAQPDAPIVCDFPVSANQATIPATLMERLPPGPATLQALVVARANVVSGDWTITFRVDTPATMLAVQLQ